MDVSERAAEGKAARSQAPRSAHAAWESPAGRADPVEVPAPTWAPAMPSTRRSPSSPSSTPTRAIADHAALVEAISSGRIEAEDTWR